MIRAISGFLNGTRPTDRRSRSRAGVLLSVLMLPLLLGVMGCFELPAPIGNPEKSRIDPAMNGIWLAELGEREGLLLIFEPWDKRTWLVRWITLEKGSDPDAEFDLDDPESLAGGVYVADVIALFKTWRTVISRKSFITMEFRVDIDSDQEMTPRTWWGARVWLTDNDQLAVHFIDNDFAEVEQAGTRRELERVVGRNHDNPELYSGDEAILLTRLPQAHYDAIGVLVEQAGLAATYH